jgi:hypothetical protein
MADIQLFIFHPDLYQSQPYQSPNVSNRYGMVQPNYIGSNTVFLVTSFQPMSEEGIMPADVFAAQGSQGISHHWPPPPPATEAHSIDVYGICHSYHVCPATASSSGIQSSFPESSRNGAYAPALNQAVDTTAFQSIESEASCIPQNNSDVYAREREFRCDGQCGKLNW